MNDIEVMKQKVLKKATLLKWGLGLAGVFVLTPVIWALAYAVLGAAALGASLILAGVIGLAAINLAPVVSMKFANWKINAIMAEAQRNPIPTLYNELERSQGELGEFEKAIIDYSAEIQNVETTVKKLIPDMQQEDVDGLRADIASMYQDLKLQQEDLDEARKNVADFGREVKRADAIWKANMAIAKANAKNMSRAEDTIAKIKKDTALDAVTSAMNKSKAQLRERIRTRTVVLSNENTPTLEFSKPVSVPHPADTVLNVVKDRTYITRGSQ